MTKNNEIYKCNVCGNIVEIIHTGAGALVCCGQDMELLEEKTDDEGQEKHVPVIEVQGNEVKVKVGSIEHPMEEAHHIQLIQLFQQGKLIKEKHLYPGQKPEALFTVETADNLIARELCNLHGLWTT